MSREISLIVVIAIAVAVLGLLAWAWVRRAGRARRWIVPVGDAPAGAVVLASFPGLYVATTAHEAPLERLAIRRLGFRSRVDIVVTDAGLALDLTGQPRIFLTPDRIVGASQSTVAIDRVVERDGLVRIAWNIDDAQTGGTTIVDSYLRPQNSSARAVIDALRPLTTTPTGTDA
ncbi:hypothetical protein [Microbacterium rhizomatis]|uniref:PH domain-containing protein n=1 Tax=Microbacterium rhizomatis TaxID=1631477 RepID=A0A5J5J612_9MICO|nr:hypothetical protein [Microbacterium rhizomatis]KAA9110564.1 hypothetical protein F6B43_02535 [Microbacterium rhizomatis]